MKTGVEFRSALFPAETGEEEQINPGRFGKRLAEFVADRLRQDGFTVVEPYAEDWGWAVEVANLSVPFMLGVGNVDGETEQFSVFIDPSTPIVKKFPFKRIDVSEDLSKVSQALERLVVSEPGIQVVDWL